MGPIQLHRGERESAQPHGERGHGPAQIQLHGWGRRGNGLAPNPDAGLGSLAAGEGGGINCHCCPATKFPNLLGALQARCYSSVNRGLCVPDLHSLAAPSVA